MKYVMKRLDGEEIAYFDTMVAMERFMLTEMEAGRLKLGHFVYTEVADDETKSILCPKCGTQIDISTGQK